MLGNKTFLFFFKKNLIHFLTITLFQISLYSSLHNGSDATKAGRQLKTAQAQKDVDLRAMINDKIHCEFVSD